MFLTLILTLATEEEERKTHEEGEETAVPANSTPYDPSPVAGL